MTMEGMVEYLENRGFLANKEYDKTSRSYIFTIHKDGRTYEESFKYPESNDWSYKNDKQREFLKLIIENFYIYNTRKDNDEEMNKLMKLAFAKEIYLNCDGTIVPITIDHIDAVNGNTKMICTLPSVIETPYHEYCRKDIAMTNAIKRKNDPIGIKNVIFNPPATVVFWTDNTKTVVKAGEYDIYDPEKGIAMAITKKVLGNQGNYYNEVRKWLDKYEEPVYGEDFLAGGIIDNESIAHAIQKAFAPFVGGAND